MQCIKDQEPDYYDDFDEFDDEGYYLSTKKPYYDSVIVQDYFPYQDRAGNEHELLTVLELIWKVVSPDYSSLDSDLDYYGYTELYSWEVVSVHDCTENSENEVNPKEVLTALQMLAYTRSLETYIQKH